MTRRQFFSTDDIRDHAMCKGSNWFSPGAKASFRSCWSAYAYDGPGGVFFVSSERFTSREYTGKRLYSVRQYHPESGSISTVGQFQEFTNGKTAQRRARYYSQHGTPAKISQESEVTNGNP